MRIFISSNCMGFWTSMLIEEISIWFKAIPDSLIYNTLGKFIYLVVYVDDISIIGDDQEGKIKLK
ncbi:hypothetical protein EPI10_028381 [Gossypium australe]|uniref:Reverse transcriptase domain-containing protein n=1 Tax=Gossypium australe TaxID=47621 RepID=A0A5B6UVP3_9ROSI|nr:hypothetical protein EPI10_028381 [Gossypium australe]